MLDKRSLRHAFERAAAGYDDAAVLQRAIADRLLARLDVVRRVPVSVLDVGSGTGYVARALQRRYPRARLTAADLAHAMVRQARARTRWRRWLMRSPGAFVCADLEQLPFADASFDLVVSNLTLQWCDPPTVFAECRRVLRPGGLFLFTSFGPDTLAELRAAWHAVDERPHVHGFADMHDLGDLLLRAGFADPVLDVERLTLTYADVLGVLRDLKRLGAHNAARGRARGLTGKRAFARFRQAYETLRTDGRIPATYEAVYGLAWAPETRAPARTADGAVAIPLTEIGRRPR
jgi:malonyl-CoA O-methyltransferase